MRKFKGNLMQIIFELDNRPYGTKGIFGFMVLKFVGERKCEFDLDFSVFTHSCYVNFLKKIGKISEKFHSGARFFGEFASSIPVLLLRTNPATRNYLIVSTKIIWSAGAFV